MHGFALSKDAGQLPHTDLRLGAWHLAAASHLPVVKLCDASGALVGAILGWAIDTAAARLLSGDDALTVSGESLDQIHHRSIRPLAGTYLAIVSIGGETRLYLDGLGNLSAVYDLESGIVGGTAADILGEAEYSARFDRDLHARFEVEREGWFPAGLTAHRGVERLMPNHFLDCERMETHRHESYAHVKEADSAQALSQIAEQIEACVTAPLAQAKPVTIGLTGGADSRLLLAGVRGIADRVEFYTVEPPQKGGSSFDVERAQELAERFSLKHTLLPYRVATASEQNLWDERVGLCVVTNNREQHPSVYPLEDLICIGGLGGEVGRCFLWKRLEALPVISATGLVDALKLPRDPDCVARVERWLAALPAAEPTRVLDLAYIELRMGSWNSAQAYANPRSTIIHPLASFAAIEAMLSLAPTYRQNDGLIYGFIQRYWPQLLDLPINRYGDYRDRLTLLRKLTNPTKLYRKLRQFVRTGG